MLRIIVAGIGTNVGKTIVSAILTTLLEGDYWKPIQSGEECDTNKMKTLIDAEKHRIHPSAYSFKAPLSPHHAARLENISISMQLVPPHTTRPLIIEGVGGIYVPLTAKNLSLELFATWNCRWIVVSKHYLGSINHTLLTCEILKRHNISVAGIIFNGVPNRDSESPILEISKFPLLGRVLPESNLNKKTIQKYSQLWRPSIHKYLH